MGGDQIRARRALLFIQTAHIRWKRTTFIAHKFKVGETESMNASKGKAGMDEATIAGLRERVHSGRPPISNQGYE
jgi:hypothetical protein